MNLLDWSKSNILAVALRQCVFLWNASTGATQKLLETGSPVIFVFGVLNAVFLWNGSTVATHKRLSNRKPVEKKLGKTITVNVKKDNSTFMEVLKKKSRLL